MGSRLQPHSASSLLSVLEPVAIHLDYWHWHTPGIPLQNYATWGVLGFLGALSYQFTSAKNNSPLPFYYLIVQLCFFLLLRFLI